MDAKILVVEDEERLLHASAIYLRAVGFTVFEAADGKTAVELYHSCSPDLVVLDISLPDISGFEVCKAIRCHDEDVGILFLTALDDDDSHMLGYQLGGDDYITKPFKISILAMKAARMVEKSCPQQKHIFKIGAIAVDTESRQCLIDGRETALTPKEFDLLLVLLKNPGRVLTREYLLKTVWAYEYDGDIRVVDAMVKKLRKKLGTEAEAIKTVISVGYKLEHGS